MSRGTFDEFLAASDIDAAQLQKVYEAVNLAHEFRFTCTGSSVYPECDWPPMQVLFLHGRPFAIVCPECSRIVGAMVIGMGHGAYRQDGILEYRVNGLELARIAAKIKADPVRELPRGKYWNATKEREWREALRKYQDG